MNLLIVLLLLGLVIVYWQRLSLGSKATPLMLGLTAAALVLVVLRFAGPSGGGSSRVETVDFPTAVGFRLGAVMAEDLPEGAKVLVLHTGDAAHASKAREQLDAYVSGLKKGSAERKLQIVPYVPDLPPTERMMLGQEYLPQELVQYVLRDHPDAKAWVSLLGPPQFSRAPPAGTLPPIYAVNVFVPEVARPLLQQGILRAIVFERQDADRMAAPTRKMSPTEVFDLRYTLERAPR